MISEGPCAIETGVMMLKIQLYITGMIYVSKLVYGSVTGI